MPAESGEEAHNAATRRVVLHVNFDDPAALNYVLNNAENIDDYYARTGGGVEIRVIAHGPGLHMLRIDTSPVLDRIKAMARNLTGLSFFACANTRERMAKAEGKVPEITSEATIVPSGIVEIIELQRAGWQYLKP